MHELKTGETYQGRSITLSDYHIYGFATLTGDFNPMHVNDEYAAKTVFKGRVAHGLLSLSLSLGLLADHVEGHFLYGFDKVRFIRPARPGMTVHATLKVAGRKEKEHYSLFQCEMKLAEMNGSEILIAETLLGVTT